MTEATAKNAIDWLLEASGNHGDVTVNLYGGEPLLRFDLIQKIVPYGTCRARQLGRSLHFACTTNCTLLTDEILAFWRRFNMSFHCSIDGIPEVQNANRPMLGGSGSSSAVEKNVPKILSYRPETSARATITPRSARVLVESAKYLAGLGFHSVVFRPAVNCGWQPEDYEALGSQLRKLGEFYLESLLAGKRFKIREFDRGIQTIHSKSVSAGACGAGRGLLLIDPRGDIWPCHRYGPQLCGGQFRFGTIGGAFDDRLRNVFLRCKMQDDLKADCKECAALLTCNSWCKAECVNATNDIYKPAEEFCQLMKIFHEEVLHFHNYLRSHHPSILSDKLKGNQRPAPSTSASS
jgi:uncharacterized protein